MAMLIHLNGPSGVGKSTLAKRFSEDHPGTLNLDVDRVATMIGGWQHDFAAALTPTRRLAVAMAETHLHNGGDVVMPQLITRHDQVVLFEDAAARAGAAFVEIALLVDPQEQTRRFFSRPGGTEHEDHIGRRIAARGGEEVLHRIHRHLLEYLASRPHPRRVPTHGTTPEQSYNRLLAAIE
ncbi:AAA family ATPase [Nocardioides sp. TF02-7]|uniref:AAA family ATPase n=1 Tax=Nocardioides sp. TF02-7 TaxID=2917724 RepID=UPI001F05D1FF|nr:AAA family ATPase [Nocardioides sp. TF02-7]UMG92862.1 AAA family ATPase [Nocardioides sp. TF02-7]